MLLASCLLCVDVVFLVVSYVPKTNLSRLNTLVYMVDHNMKFNLLGYSLRHLQTFSPLDQIVIVSHICQLTYVKMVLRIFDTN